MAEVKAVPDGYATITPFFNVKGASDAIEFFKKAFGAEERRRFTTPDGVIALAELKIGTSIVRVSDAIKDPPTQSNCQLYVDDVDAWWKRATEAGCEVVWPLQNMFFGDRFGIVKDRFGNRWALASHIEDVEPEELRRRGETANLPR